MADYKIQWDQVGEKIYETGCDHGVLYLLDPDTKDYPKGVAWNGLSQVTENKSGADENAIYADNIKYLSLRGAEDYGVTIECYTKPDEFDACDGTATLTAGVKVGQQTRKAFGLSWRTKIGNDIEADDYGFKIHLAYNLTASPSEASYQTINDSPEANTMSYEASSTPIAMPNGLKPSSSIVIDSTAFKTEQEKAKLDSFLEILYGTGSTEAKLPLPAEVFSHFSGTSNPGQSVG